jgi:hypothetical protein
MKKMSFGYKESRECLICKKEFIATNQSRWICADCETEYGDFDAILSACKEDNNEPSDFKLNDMYSFFFPTREELESALDYYIKEKMPVKEVSEKCIEFCRNDPFWFSDWVVPKVHKRG